MSWAIQLALALCIFVAGGWTGIEWEEGQQAQRDLERMNQETQARNKKVARADKAAVGYEAAKVQIETEFVPITVEVERVVEKPVYRNLCVDADGLRLITSAIAGSATASQPAPALPRPDGTD